jgi:muramoyltetrapeptide carboxypeptidase
MFKRLGCKVITGDTAQYKSNHKYRYLSDSDEERNKEFMDFTTDPKINAVFAARGGYGSIRILDLLDFDAIKNNPKMIIGFSDVTAILLAVHKLTGIVTYHGPSAKTVKNSFSQKHLEEICFYDTHPQPHIVPAVGMRTINQGKALGRLVGGNLTVMMSLMGTPYEVETDGKILFIEEVSERADKIDRFIKQLQLSGKLENLAGIMIGTIKNLNYRRTHTPHKGYTIKEVFMHYFTQYDYPVVYGMPFGHGDDNITMPIGTYAEFDTSKKQLILHNSI